MTKLEYEKLRKAKNENRRLERRLQREKNRIALVNKGILEQKRSIKSENQDYVTGYQCGLSWVEGLIAEVYHEKD